MTESLDGLKKDYEDKLISFESLLKESNSKIQELQDYDPIIRLIKSNPDIITHYKESLERKIAGKPDEQGNDQIKQQISEEDQKKLALFEKKVAQMELIMQKKDKIYEELTKNLELKDTEIKKMDEIIQNYKALLQHLTEEKNILNKENQRLTKENELYMQYFSQLENQANGDMQENENAE